MARIVGAWLVSALTSCGASSPVVHEAPPTLDVPLAVLTEESFAYDPFCTRTDQAYAAHVLSLPLGAHEAPLSSLCPSGSCAVRRATTLVEREPIHRVLLATDGSRDTVAYGIGQPGSPSFVPRFRRWTVDASDPPELDELWQGDFAIDPDGGVHSVLGVQYRYSPPRRGPGAGQSLYGGMVSESYRPRIWTSPSGLVAVMRPDGLFVSSQRAPDGSVAAWRLLENRYRPGGVFALANDRTALWLEHRASPSGGETVFTLHSATEGTREVTRELLRTPPASMSVLPSGRVVLVLERNGATEVWFETGDGRFTRIDWEGGLTIERVGESGLEVAIATTLRVGPFIGVGQRAFAGYVARHEVVYRRDLPLQNPGPREHGRSEVVSTKACQRVGVLMLDAAARTVQSVFTLPMQPVGIREAVVAGRADGSLSLVVARASSLLHVVIDGDALEPHEMPLTPIPSDVVLWESRVRSAP